MPSKLNIQVDNTKCTGCLTCALHCSYTKLDLFNPMNAYIRVCKHYEQPNSISFTEDCDRCGVCVRHCAYGALVAEKEP